MGRVRRLCGARPGLVALGLVTSGAAAADPGSGLLAAREAWAKLTVDDAPAADFAFSDGGTLRVEADGAVAFLYRAVNAAPAGIAWAWRVDEGIAATDPTAKGKDDRPIALHLWFDTGDRDKTLYGDLARLMGYPTVTHGITYVWGATRPEGSLVTNPYYERGRILVLRRSAAASRGWVTERRDIAADLARAFPDAAIAPGDLAYVVVSADTDDRGGRSRARIRNLGLARDGGAPGQD